ncbi:MAG: DUF3072 domain-containing protein [Methyloceanibacter sp.]|jgi:hypothetical protein|nr:DUF3072 domain-containing protein [Methyloceanibacter sp.]
MTQKKKTQEIQESQYPSPGTSNPAREPMTGAQASHLKMLADEIQEPAAFQQGLSKLEASRRIDALIEKLRLGFLPPHTD